MSMFITSIFLLSNIFNLIDSYLNNTTLLRNVPRNHKCNNSHHRKYITKNKHIRYVVLSMLYLQTNLLAISQSCERSLLFHLYEQWSCGNKYSINVTLDLLIYFYRYLSKIMQVNNKIQVFIKLLEF